MSESAEYRYQDRWMTKRELERALTTPLVTIPSTPIGVVCIYGRCYHMHEYAIVKADKFRIVRIYRDAKGQEFINVLDQRIDLEKTIWRLTTA